MNGSQENQPTPPVETGEAAAAVPPNPAQPQPQPQAPQAGAAPPQGAPGSPRGWFQIPQTVAQDPRAKSAPLAMFLSLMPGLGQVYTGYYIRGFGNAITVALIITLLATGDMDELTPFLGLFLAFFWMHNIIDAGRRATFYNQMLAGGTDTDAFPPEMKMPGMGGSIFAGLGLIVIGMIALSYTKYDMSLAWIEDWWPVAPILVGVYLVGLAVRDKMQADDA